MAGSEKEMDITCDVIDFEMDPISFKGVVSNIDIDTDIIDTSEITNETSKITNTIRNTSNQSEL